MKITATLLLLGLLTPVSLQAQEKTYGGRTYAEWKILVPNDLDPETRSKGMSAIGVFGHNGHRADAFEFLQGAVVSESHSNVVKAGYAALLTFGDDAVPAIKAGLAEQDDRKRRLVVESLSDFFSSFAARNRPTTELAKEAVPTFLDLLQDAEANRRDRVTTARTLSGIFRIHASEEFAEKYLPTLMEFAKSSDTDLALHAIRTIGGLGKHAAPAVPLLISYIEPDEVMGRRVDARRVARLSAALIAIQNIGPAAEEAVPALEQLKQSRGGFGRDRSIQQALDAIQMKPADN